MAAITTAAVEPGHGETAAASRRGRVSAPAGRLSRYPGPGDGAN